MKASFKTDVGKVREKNEDSIMYRKINQYILAAVADGMGGHQSGEIASKMALSACEDYFVQNQSNLSQNPEQFMSNLFKHSCRVVYEASKNNANYQGMGTTLTLAIVDLDKQVMYVGNIGDSRLYIFQDHGLKQLTEDHSLVNEMLRLGKITVEESHHHPQRNVLTKALGTCDTAIPDYFTVDMINISMVLLCSDGLSNYFEDKELSQIIVNNLENAVDQMIEEAKNRGGTDNISVILLYQ